MKIVWTPKAVFSLNEIFDYILIENPIQAIRVRDRFFEKTSLLETSPFLGTQYEVDTRKLPLGDFPYTIYYRVKKKQIEILQIRHEKRNQPSLP